MDDNSIAFSFFNWSGDDKMLENAHLNVLVHNKEVLITGEVPTIAAYNYITTQAPLQDVKIKKIINEVYIAPNSSLLSRAKDALITGEIDALFLGQQIFNPVHVKVTTENRTVYLMGSVTAREASKATKISSSVSGVKRIVKLFHYLKKRPAAEIAREKEKEAQKEQAAKLESQQVVIDAKKADLLRQIRALDPKGGTNF
ncbi:21 kDa hemolysin precursor [uncultured Candidatus Thioglobus sp.]|nr:21 kDa hemolysin precursor [uncultured Candidatus Thioglobus sp.]